MNETFPSEPTTDTLVLDLDLSSLAHLSLSNKASEVHIEQSEEVAGILLNEDGSIWLENKSFINTEILDLESNTSARLHKGDVAQVRSGQGLNISGNYFRLNIEGSTISLSSLNSQPNNLQARKQLL